ncbi:MULTISPECIES: NADH-quinone oxidoreductase subunit J [unclassified Actinomyces]|uniref:NADH-quinone oxidoreductase subunit J n=2 Tax=Actinomyces TaxID=1654 RepID=UPI002016C1ED|nr:MULTISPECIES: NADH-quinone oxidoreductase subunit J [unclassified Actinomyces]MCL3776942.1 NADH-quinone oxidoreductase subunit J [Actinomyces sp. AC-20-1]MCL3789179.1 NADH-quinone oxidoreductase subunit J [Actinomyces sp. 187325]MCL3791938.1 NADH-quinone oxidoreductase subunit J [Actinomyces sp. 186855]MCL3794555.1 NADH-quinone oxidoreductase subunit J [Actinomyces sp. 217892]
MATALPATLTDAGTMGTGETVLLAVVALLCVACGLGLLVSRRAVTAAVNMIGVMIGLAILYIANEAPFLGVVQVVVYTGAVMTLVLFVVMLVGVGGDEPVVGTGGRVGRAAMVAAALGLALVVGAVVTRTVLPAPRGLADSAAATPASLAVVLFGQHVVTMELTGLLLIVAATGALTLTHRERIRAKVTQRSLMEGRMKAYKDTGAHPGQKTMTGVYAATNAATAPALAASGEAVEESVPRVLRVRGQALDLADVSPELAAAQRSGEISNRMDARVGQSGMDSMPGAAAPAVVQPVAAPELEAGAPQDDDPAALPTDAKEEGK